MVCCSLLAWIIFMHKSCNWSTDNTRAVECSLLAWIPRSLAWWITMWQVLTSLPSCAPSIGNDNTWIDQDNMYYCQRFRDQNVSSKFQTLFIKIYGVHAHLSCDTNLVEPPRSLVPFRLVMLSLRFLYLNAIVSLSDPSVPDVCVVTSFWSADMCSLVWLYHTTFL